MRCQHSIGLLSRKRLGSTDADSLPPIFIYPHGIVQRQVDITYVAEYTFQHHELEICEQFHLAAFRLILDRNPEVTDPNAAGSAPIPSATAPAPKIPLSCLKWNQDGGKYYVIVPLTNELNHSTTAAETYSDADGWLHTDEEDEIVIGKDDVVREILLAQEAVTAEMRTSKRVKSIPPQRCPIDFAFMQQFVNELTRPTPNPPTPQLLRNLCGMPHAFLLETCYNGRFYLNLAETCESNSLSPFPNKEFASYYDYYQQRWPSVKISHPEEPLLYAVNYTLTPMNVLLPYVLSDKKKKHIEPKMKLLQDSVKVWMPGAAEFIQIMKMLPSILYRLEVNIIHLEFLTKYKLRSLNPHAVRQAFTTGNAQENIPLKPAEAQPSNTEHAKQYRSIPSSQVHSYERLKFVGDACMKLVLTKLLLAAYPCEREEAITERKGKLINQITLANLAWKLGLQHLIVNQPFHPQDFIPPGIESKNPSPISSFGSVIPPGTTSLLPAQISRTILADVLVSLVGAAWISGAERCCLDTMIALGIVPQSLVELVLRPEKEPIGQNIQQQLGEDLAPVVERLLHSCHARLNALIPNWEYYVQPGSQSLARLIASRPHIEGVLDYKFNHVGLLVQSFTHSSWEQHDRYRKDHYDNDGVAATSVQAAPHLERLELLGDAVLELIVSDFIFNSFPFRYLSSSGDLTFLRQRMVNNDMLVRVIVDVDFHPFLMHTSDLVNTAIDVYVQHRRRQSNSIPIPTAPKMLADTFESLLGAVYIDSGFRVGSVWDVYSNLLDFKVNWDTLKIFPEHSKNVPVFDIKVKGGRCIRDEDRRAQARQSELEHLAQQIEAWQVGHKQL